MFEIGQEVKALSRSTSTTSIAGSHRRMYLAAVAPPKPPPITTTRPLDGGVLAQPASDAAPASLRQSLRFMVSSLAFLRGEPGRQRVDLRVRVALGDLVHHGGRALAVAEIPQLLGEVIRRNPGERGHVPGHRAALGAV